MRSHSTGIQSCVEGEVVNALGVCHCVAEPEPSTSRRLSEYDNLNRGGARPRDNTGPRSNTGPRNTQTPSKGKSVDWELPGSSSRTVVADGPQPTTSLMSPEQRSSSSEDSDHFYNKPV